MPKIYEYIGFVFFFYSKEHLPIHCHVKKGSCEIKVELQYEDGKLIVRFIKIKEKNKFNNNELRNIEIFINKHHIQIVENGSSSLFMGKNLILNG